MRSTKIINILRLISQVIGFAICIWLLIDRGNTDHTSNSASVAKDSVRNENIQDSLNRVISQATTIKHENHNQYVSNITNIYTDTVRNADDIDSALARIYDSLYQHRFASIIEK